MVTGPEKLFSITAILFGTKWLVLHSARAVPVPIMYL